MRKIATWITCGFGVVLAGLGLWAVAEPSILSGMGNFFKVSPGAPILIASIIRILFGVIIIIAARDAQFKWVLYPIGILVTVAGITTTFAGNQMAENMLSLFDASKGDGGLRIWALIVVIIGVLSAYSAWPVRKNKEQS